MAQLLEMRGIEKSFPGVHALADCRFDLNAGEVHALVGENGAGKSTLMKCLSGVYQKDAGQIILNGEEVSVHNVHDAQNLGIRIIHQEINLMQDLTVAQNIWIGREPMKGIFTDDRKLNADTRKLLDSLHLNQLSPTTPVKKLTVALQQMVEIAKALSFDSTKIMIMDEPTAALTESEIEDLFKFIKILKEKGVGIIYISHRLEELRVVADRVTVMRDGRYIDTKKMSDVTLPDIIQMMVGRVIYEEPKSHSMVADDAPVVLECEHLCSKDVHDVSFQLKKGEILGFAGLMGAGRTETMRLICGADPMESGTIKINGKPVTIKSPQDAVKKGIGYLSEDRKRFGLCLGLPVSDNTVLPTLDEYSKAGVVQKKRVTEMTGTYIESIKIKTPGTEAPVRGLSGGNQQKVVIAKWLEKNCDILIFDEPTRGIDVGAKSEIYRLMTELAESGKSIIMISSELPEILRMSDRIIVLCEGVKTGEMLIQDANQEKIMHYATGGK